ncbi:glycosyltransferase [Methanoplanus endosymbiosus]|uniref:Glycosyltransferase n=1 Tax=Methanoplanus endosymbiosus TaxID=33865 RepID=A0A9E7PKY0_9EURY|nr:glycosyltransferase [Methanoplanus endosymbiosus]UUX91810.1 glycosyltransferase [Methanoplanus endosymbiosus]
MTIKILIISSNYPRVHNETMGWFLHEIPKRLDKDQYTIYSLTPHCHKCRRIDFFDGVEIHRFRYFIPSLQRLAYGSGIAGNFHTDHLAKIQVPLFLISEVLSALKLCKDKKIQIIHTHWLLPQGLAGAICKKLIGVKHVANIHGSDINTISKSKFLIKVAGFIVKYSDIVIANSSYTKEKLLSICPQAESKCKIIPMGVDLTKFDPNIENIQNDKKNILIHRENIQQYSEYNDLSYLPKGSKPVILSIGRLIGLKGTEYLIQSIIYLTKAFPEIIIIIAGIGPEKERLEQLVQKLKLSEKVVFKGFISHELAIEYYKFSDVFVLPSVNLNGQTEGLGVVLLEAMACKTPVIGSNVGGIPDIIKDGRNGFLVPEKDPEAIAGKIKIILDNNELREKFITNGYTTVKENFSWDIILKKNEEIYRKLVES